MMEIENGKKVKKVYSSEDEDVYFVDGWIFRFTKFRCDVYWYDELDFGNEEE